MRVGVGEIAAQHRHGVAKKSRHIGRIHATWKPFSGASTSSNEPIIGQSLPASPDLVAVALSSPQVLDPVDFLAGFTQHIPPKGSHSIRHCGWSSNKARGMRRKAAQAEAAEQAGARCRSEASEAPAPQPMRPNLGHADQAGLRNRRATAARSARAG